LIELGAKSYIVDTKRVKKFPAEKSGKKGRSKTGQGAKMLLKTHVEKMSAFRFANILLKIKDLFCFCHDVVEKTSGY